MVKSQGPGYIGDSGVYDPSVRLPGLRFPGPHALRGTDDTRRDVWVGGVLWYVTRVRLHVRKLIWELVGSVYGAFQGYARAFYAELLPPGEEARWYGLFSITDKVSAYHSSSRVE